jgi:peptide deformylase
MFVMEGPEGRLNIINPHIGLSSLKPAGLKEGCLSAPGEFMIVPSRVDWVMIEYQDENGDPKHVTLKGIHSVCAQHEIEHLN